MKHTLKITAIIVSMFLLAQIIGLVVANMYLPEKDTITNPETNLTEIKENYNIPYGFDPPQGIESGTSVLTIVFGIILAVLIFFLIMKLNAKIILRVWFFVVVIIGIALAVNAFIIKIPGSTIIALAIAIPLAYIKIFKRNIIIHNITELLIYPGIASVFAPLLTISSTIALLILISVYDIYAVWHAGFMQKMAQYQIKELRVFSGFFIPYISKKDKSKLKNKKARVKVNVAILGGGDVVFPIILTGVVLKTLGLVPAFMIIIFSTLALSLLLYYSQKGKFYPAMPFISAGCFVGIAMAYLLS